MVSRNADCRIESRDGGNPPVVPLMPVIDVADVHADEAIAAMDIQPRQRESARMVTVLIAQ
jgi:hypothetical protein